MKVQFDHSRNTYVGNGKPYIRASSLYGAFKEPFNALEVATKYAKKHGRTPEYWMEEWSTGTEEACDRGSRFHDYKEKVTKDTNRYIFWDTQVAYMGEREEENYYEDWPDGVYTEVVLWHHGLRIAGRCDIMILYTEHGVRYMHLDDYKTCKRIDKLSYFDHRTGLYKKMYPPISHLMDCNLVHFQLQMSTYQLCGEFLGFKPGNRRVLHYPQSEYGKLTGTEDFVKEPIIYDLPYLKKEVISMANHYHDTL
jgi:hypothetical protein